MHWLVWFASMLDGEHETRTEVMLEVCPPPEVPVWEPPQPKRQAAQSAERKGQTTIFAIFMFLPPCRTGPIT